MSRRSCGRVFQREGRRGHYVRFRVRGCERERYGGPTKAVAHTMIARVEAELGLDRSPGALDAALKTVFGTTDTPLTFREIADKYKTASVKWKRPSTIREDGNRLERIKKASWTGKKATDIIPQDIARWLEARRQAKGVSGATLNRDRSLVSAVCTWAVSMGFASVNPARGVRRFDERGRARETYLTPKEATGLLDHCAPHLRPVVLAALTTGLRRGTLCELRWKNVDLEAGHIAVQASIAKGKRPQLIPLVPELAATLKKLRNAQKVRHISGEDFVFRMERGGAWLPNELSRQFRAAVKNCTAIPEDKRKDVVLHTCRHTFASWLTMSDVHQRVIQEALAHSTPTLTARYEHLRPGAMGDAIKAVGGVLRGATVSRRGAKRGAKANRRGSRRNA